MKNNKQHYVPKFYLKGFATSDGIIVRNLETGTREIRNPKSIGYGWKYHNVSIDILSQYFDLDQYSKDDYVDHQLKLFHEDIMADFIRSFDDIQNQFITLQKHHKRVIDTYSLIDILMVQLIRSPFFINIIRERNTKSKEPEIDQSNIILLLFVLHKAHYPSNQIVVKPLFKEKFKWYVKFIEDLKSELSKKVGVLLINRTTIPFVTSDNPVVYFPSTTSLFLSIYFPINKSVSLLITDKDKKVDSNTNHNIEIQTKESSIRKWNSILSTYAVKYLFIPNGLNILT